MNNLPLGVLPRDSDKGFVQWVRWGRNKNAHVIFVQDGKLRGGCCRKTPQSRLSADPTMPHCKRCEVSLGIFLKNNRPGVIEEIESEQRHGRQKYGGNANSFTHDDGHSFDDWLVMILGMCDRADKATPIDCRQYLIKIAGLAKSAVEAFDRKNPK